MNLSGHSLTEGLGSSNSLISLVIWSGFNDDLSLVRSIVITWLNLIELKSKYSEYCSIKFFEYNLINSNKIIP